VFPKGTRKEEAMSQEAVEKFLGRLLTDNKCLRIAQSAVSAACYKAGCDLSDEELASITQEDLVRIELIAERLDSRIKRFSE